MDEHGRQSPLSEHVVEAARAGSIRRRGWTWVGLFILLGLLALLADVVLVFAVGDDAMGYRSPFLYLIAPLYAWLAIRAAWAVRRMRGEYRVRRFGDRVEAFWGDQPWGTVRLGDRISIRKNLLGDPVLHSPRGKVSLFPELSDVGSLHAALGAPDIGVPLSATQTWVGTAAEAHAKLAPGTTHAELEQLRRWERISGGVGMIGAVLLFASAFSSSALAFASAIALALGGLGLAMHLRGRHIRKHEAYRFGLIGDFAATGAMAKLTGRTLELVGGGFVVLGSFGGVVALIVAFT